MAQGSPSRHKKTKRQPSLATRRRASLEVMMTQIVDRWNDAYENGIIQEIRDPTSGEEVLVIRGGFPAALNLVSPRDFPIKLRDPQPTATAPGSPDRIQEYRRRFVEGEKLEHDGDANHLEGAVTAYRLNSTGLKVLGRLLARHDSGPPRG